MMYQYLANLYDALVADDEATQMWVDFVKQHIPGKDVLELACGSGEFANALSNLGYKIHATDISEDMVERCKQKYPNLNVSVLDMRRFQLQHQFDGICCFCDSINYCIDAEEIQSLLACVAEHLKPEGVFLCDMHTSDRLIEFEEEYIEEGQIDGIDYQWSILSEDDFLLQHFTFYVDGKMIQEDHVQRVMDADVFEQWANQAGLSIEWWTDFIHPGKVAGEKYFMVMRRI